MRGIGVIILCLVVTTLSKPDAQSFEDSPLGRLLVRRPVHNRVRVVRPKPVGGGLLGPLVGLGLLGSLLGRSDLRTADLENANLNNEYEEDGLGRILVRRPVYKRVRVVRPRPGIFGGYRRPSAAGLFGNLLGLGLGATLLGGLLGRSDLPTADLERAYSEDEVEAIIGREVDAAVEAGKDLDRNGDGKVDRNEFHWTFPELDLYEEFGKLDTDNSGFIEQDELVEEKGRDDGCGEYCYFDDGKCKCLF